MESKKDMLDRLKAMSTNQYDNWDLSKNDENAIQYAVACINNLAELQNRTCETCKHYRITHDMEIGICKQNNLSWKPNEFCSAYENKEVKK